MTTAAVGEEIDSDVVDAKFEKRFLMLVTQLVLLFLPAVDDFDFVVVLVILLTL